jgi:signal recognition particle receptor subunit beta
MGAMDGMALINTASREIQCKIVYYGIGRSGKTTNVEFIHKNSPEHTHGQMLSVATIEEKTLTFDLLPVDLGLVHGYHIRFHLYTVPGQIRYEQTRHMILNNVDGIVQVVDSSRDRLEENYSSLVELETQMMGLGKDLAQIPLVIQWNKRDLPDALDISLLNRYLNRHKSLAIEATALTGVGVFPTLRQISQIVMARL